MPVLEAISLSTIGKVIATTWANGSRLVWSVAVACGATAATLRLCDYLQVARADLLWQEYGLYLIVAAVVFAVLAAFKMRAERRNTGLSLIADEQQSFWHHAKQPDGTVLTQFEFRFHATNMSEGSIHLSKVRLNWPWVSRKRIFTTHLMTQHPNQGAYGSEFAIKAHSRRACSAHLMVRGTVGGARRKKPIRVSMSVQDHGGRWHKLIFPLLRDPGISR